VQRNDDDDEALEPHAYIHQNRHDENQNQIVADLPKPEQLRHEHIAGDHDPVAP
jgi:hypothetical protein